MTRQVRLRTRPDGSGTISVHDGETGTRDWQGEFDRHESSLSSMLREAAHYLDVTRARERRVQRDGRRKA